MPHTLSYEQYVVLKLMRDSPDQEGSALAKAAECSWDELFQLSKLGFVDIGDERLSPKRMHPTITEAGKRELSLAEAQGLL